ncbi:hypothetical protein L484_012096 [Morus notabilis]|uniref:Uncharacterized protein n=1 Tax=Morus notabilis TaxID=981085 RepID=W9RL44_9ROSA|nr:hypothetical protein L484_012096 [Morus notabilis]
MATDFFGRIPMSLTLPGAVRFSLSSLKSNISSALIRSPSSSLLFFGSILNHNLFLAIHELSHNLAFSKPVYNLQPSYWGSHVGHFPELSPVCLKQKPPGSWEFVNFVIQIALNAAMVYFWSWKFLQKSKNIEPNSF